MAGGVALAREADVIDSILDLFGDIGEGLGRRLAFARSTRFTGAGRRRGLAGGRLFPAQQAAVDGLKI